jgi:copper resistance protein B
MPQQAPGQPVDHAAMGHGRPPPEPAGTTEHAGHDMASPADHAAMGHDLPATAPPRDPIPALTPADRVAAFPEVAGHVVHDNGVHSFVLLDRLETWDADANGALAWEGLAWVGTDLDRLWVRSEGEALDDGIESADVELLYGRAIARWWDGVVGIRHDFGDDPSQTFVAVGVMGLAPYKFEVEATAYFGQDGQTGASVEVEYDTLLTNRLILQWLAEAEVHGKDDPSRGIGSGLGTVEAGLRLRYEFNRRFAPYIGMAWERAYGRTADFRRDEGEDTDDTRFVAGLRIWF